MTCIHATASLAGTGKPFAAAGARGCLRVAGGRR